MASTVMVSSAATMSRAAAPAAPTSSVAPFVGLKSMATFPRRSGSTGGSSLDMSSLPSNGGRVRCFNVWSPENNKRFETLSYLPALSEEDLAKEIDYLLRNNWVPCLEFSKEGFVYRENDKSPGYYDGRYWTMWKLPMFGCTDSSQVLAELENAKKAYPNYYHRVIGFDNQRQTQCVSFIAYKPPSS